MNTEKWLRASPVLHLLLAGLIFSGWCFASDDTEDSAETAEKLRIGMLGTALHTDNLDKQVDFYTAGLGMVVLRTIDLDAAKEVILGFGKGRTEPVILLYAQHHREMRPEDALGNFPGRIVLKTNNVDSLVEQLHLAGYKTGEVKQNPVNNMKVVWVNDPDGNSLEIVESP